MRKTALRTAAAVAALVTLSFPHDSASQSCSDPAARNLLAGAYSDGVINPPGQEDNQFFTSAGGFPNIFFLIDTSSSMQRLPPNGPAFLTGLNVDPSTLPTTGMVGCGTDPSLGGLPAGSVLDVVMSRTYHSPCGATAWEGVAYQGHDSLATGQDYAQLASVCPYYTPSNTFTTGVPGYDQDFYTASDVTSSGGGKPNLFPKNLVLHDSIADGPTWAFVNGDPNGNYGNGWNFTTLFPWQKSNNQTGSMTDFCAAQGTTPQNGLTRETICNACLTQKGWYYDGNIKTQTQEGITNAPYPSLWYTGNYLSFFPPKFMIARRVVKDTISSQTRIRMALAQFSGTGGSGSGGYQLVRDFNPSCQSIFGNGNWDSNRSTYVNDVNSLAWGGGTPISMALFDVGRYYHTATLPWFGSSWENSGNGYESATSANQLAVCWSCQVSSVIILTDGVPSSGDGSGSGQAGLPNQTGATPTSPCASIADSNSGKFAGDTNTCVLTPSSTDCPECYDFTGTEDYKNNLTKVAFYMHNYDLRGEAAGSCGGNGGTLDGMGMPGKQTLDIYTIGFGTGTIGAANQILSNTAEAGGGIFYGAESADQLKDGVNKAFLAINQRATSFSVATVSTLQTTTGHSVIVPRFVPSKNAHWEGHLSRYELYSEFVNSCIPNGPGDLDCDGQCNSVFLTDKNGAFIGEDGNGGFMLTDNGLPTCSQTPQCVAQGKSCGAVGNVPASPWWDAYEALKNQGWRTRYVWTVTDDQLPYGQLDSSDTMLRLDTSDATADALVPYLGLGTNGSVCSDIAAKIDTAGDAATAQVVRTSKRDCAKTIIRWLLGADVLNEVGRSAAQGWPPPRPDMTSPPSATNLPDQDQLLDRRFKLGDIYHSSPIEVTAPLPYDGVLCANGLSNQCLPSLWLTPTKNVSNVNQYDLYQKSSAYQYRRKIILVGANDGLVHAFNGGRWHPNADDPVTTALDESKPPFSGYYDRGEQDGAVEVWAFLPPDLLGKVPNLLGGEHHFFVDGTAQVRDVWVDGTDNGLSPAGSLDGMKAASEFHTVAVMGERRGGNHYFALDLTNATNLPSESGAHGPKFLWIYPQPNDPESLSFGETYDAFLPRPPPVGPIRVKADSNAQSFGLADATNSPSVYTPEDPLNAVKYHELWVVLLAGGFDPSYQRGRGVHMIDVWRGKEVFDFSYPTDPTVVSYDPRQNLQYPVAATPGMVMWGTQARRQTGDKVNDAFFDTATFGDVGGQLWVLRFNRPGTMDPNGKVSNWYGGRVFTHGYQWAGRRELCTEYLGHPFFYITANTALPSSRVYRVFVGTGDRFNLLDTNGGTCGPDNIRACAQRGCTVNQSITENVLAATGAGYLGEGTSQPVCWNTLSRTQDNASAPPTCGTTSSQRIEVSACPNATSASAFSKDVMVKCSPDAAGSYGCVTSKASLASAQATLGNALDLGQNLGSHPMSRNWYYSIKVFYDTGNHGIFDDFWGAYNYDASHTQLWDEVLALTPAVSWSYSSSDTNGQPLVIIDGSAANPTTLASSDSPGWALYYNHGPTVTTSDHTYSVNMLDERTSSVSGLGGGVITWNAIQQTLGEATSARAGCAQSKCQGAYYRVSYHYGADPVTGGSVFFDLAGNKTRVFVSNTLVPAQGDQPTVFVNQKGQIAVGQTAVNPEKGASNVGMSNTIDPVQGLGVLEVSRALHDCRHFIPAAGPGGALTAAERTYLATKCGSAGK
jgi:type IV pilus assembly protein PilY1